jgi:cysteine desulfurase/selenocysteine lyase
VDDAIRADFPMLQRTLDGAPVVYLDSAATSLKPTQVLDAERAYSTQFTANIHRGKHALSEEASAAYELARRRVAHFIGAEPRSTVFVRNTTEALNLVADGLGLSSQDVVLAPLSEHHSNLLPWMRRARLQWLECDVQRPLDLGRVAEEMERCRPKVLALAWASNLTGVIQPIAALCALAREHGVISVVDAAQAAPHLRLNVGELGCDFLAFSGHKMLAPTGIGVLWGKPERLEALPPTYLGGGAVERVSESGFTLKGPPHRFEAGTPNISGAIGLGAAVTYLEQVGWERINAHERALSQALTAGLDDLPRAKVFIARDTPALAMACIVPQSESIGPDQIALALSDSFRIMVRSGFHCAHPYFDRHRIKLGAIRVSTYLYNTVEEVEYFVRCTRKLLETLLPR